MRSLEQFSFSSQFYFLAYMGLTGNLWMIIGFMIILQTGINPYEDILVLPLLVLNQLILYLIERLMLYLRRKLKIWEYKEETAKKAAEANPSHEVAETNQTLMNADNTEILKLEFSSSKKGEKTLILKKKSTAVESLKKQDEETEEESSPRGDTKPFNIYYRYREYEYFIEASLKFRESRSWMKKKRKTFGSEGAWR